MSACTKYIIIIVSIIFISGCSYSSSSTTPIRQPKNRQFKTKESKNFTVRGNSLEPRIIEDTEMMLIKETEYKRDDIIMYDFAGHKTPIAKIIKGVPGDT